MNSWPRAWPTRHRLGLGLLLSMGLHGLFLAWAWPQTALPDQALPEISQASASARAMELVWVQAADQTKSEAPTPALSARPARPTAKAAAPQRPASPANPRPHQGMEPRPAPAQPQALEAPAEAQAGAAEAKAQTGAAALARLLDSGAARQAVEQAAKQPLLPTPRRQPNGLAQAMQQAGRGDCARGEFRGSGMGLLSLPMLAAAALQGECR